MRKPPNSSCLKLSPPLIPASHVSGALDKNAASPKAFTALKAEGSIPVTCKLRQVKYMNNLVEQAHQFIKRLMKSGLGFFSFETAWRALQGYEAMNMIRKGQMQGMHKGDIPSQTAVIAQLFGVAV
jgi:transposase, IS6 family